MRSIVARTSSNSTLRSMHHNHHTKHLPFHFAPPPHHAPSFHSRTKCETTLIFIFLLKDNFGILKVYVGVRRSHGGARRNCLSPIISFEHMTIYSNLNPILNIAYKNLYRLNFDYA